MDLHGKTPVLILLENNKLELEIIIDIIEKFKNIFMQQYIFTFLNNNNIKYKKDILYELNKINSKTKSINKNV